MMIEPPRWRCARQAAAAVTGRSRAASATAALATAVVAASTLIAGCSSATHGNGHASTIARPSGTRTPDFPSSESTPSTGSSGTSSSEPSPSVTPTTVTITGTSTQQVYAARVYAADDISDCVAHAYGAKMIAFLRQHPCGLTHRALALVDDLSGRAVVVSCIATSFKGTAQDPYVASSRFQKLETADGTGSINDLLREGHSIPGVATRIPAHEAFQVVGQDNGVDVFDAWYASGPTRDQDPALMRLEQDLFLTPLTIGR